MQCILIRDGASKIRAQERDTYREPNVGVQDVGDVRVRCNYLFCARWQALTQR